MHIARVEDEAGTVEQTTKVIVAQDEDRCFVLNILVHKELRVVCGIGCNDREEDQEEKADAID